MPYKIEIFIGSDNNTRKIGKNYLERIRKWADKVFPNGYTLLRSKGFYNGVSEDSVIISVLSDKDLALEQDIKQLRNELKQDSVLLAKYFVDLEVF
jgi:hypothetical protein